MKKIKFLILALMLSLGMATATTSHDVEAKKADVVVKNNKKKVISVTKYHANNKVAYEEKNSYFANGKVKQKTIIKRNTSGAKTYDYKRVNYNNGKAKQITTYSNYVNGGYKKREIKKYRTNGKRSFVEYVTRNNSHVRTEVKKYYYNKKGQLKTNKNGSAKRVIIKYTTSSKTTNSKNSTHSIKTVVTTNTTTTTTHKYNAKGKLYGKNVKTSKKSTSKVTKTKLAVAPKPVNPPTTTNPTVPSQAELDKVGDEVIRLLNVERTKKGLKKVTKNNLLTQGANIRAKEISTKFSHTRPNGKSFSSVMMEIDGAFTETENGLHGSSTNFSGENITKCNSLSLYDGNYKLLADEIYTSWYYSPEHYKNMAGDYTDIGIGLYTVKEGVNEYTYAVMAMGDYFQY